MANYQYPKKVTIKNNLKTIFPNLASEWDYKKNKLKPNEVHPLANKVVWWLCKNGHNWEQRISYRATGTQKCARCTGRIPTNEKNLKTDYPEIFSQWDYKKNKDLDPLKIATGSPKIVWWRCKKKHSWKASIDRRTRNGSACKKCTYKLESFLIKDNNPELFKQIHPTKNKFDINKLTVGSGRLVWFKCSKGHEWRTTVNSRRKSGYGCRKCSHQSRIVENIIKEKKFHLLVKKDRLSNLSPVLSRYWHPTLNEGLMPIHVSAFSSKKVWWKCKEGHSYQQNISSKKQLFEKNNTIVCPLCTGRILTYEKSLEFLDERIAKEWDQKKNKIKASEVFYKSAKQNYWWKCKHGHTWQTTVYHRTVSKSDCPYCKISSSLPEIRIYSELMTLFKNVRHRYYYDKNFEIDIFLPDQKIAIEYDGWYFHKDRYEKDVIKNRKIKNFNLKLIRIREEGLTPIDGADLYVGKTKLIKEDLNKIVKKIESYGFKNSKTKKYKIEKKFVNEKLYRKIQYFLPAPAYNESFKVRFPEIAKEFDLIKNAPLKPEHYTPFSSKKVWWKCKRGHSWNVDIGNRTTSKSNCPTCVNLFRDEFRKPIENNILDLYPEIAKEWNYKKNETKPDMFTAGSKYKAWWNCKNCNTSYLRCILDRTKLNRSCTKCFPRIYNEKKNNITITYPKIALEWDYKKNKNINIKTITPGATRFKYWWKCSRCRKSYQRDVRSKVKYINLLSCKFH
jgi:hypothetical protein